MARILITAAGTLGDHLPAIHLGRALAARGHRVTMGVNSAMADRVARAGLAVEPLGGPLGPAEAAAAATHWDAWRGDDLAEPLGTPEWVDRSVRHVRSVASMAARCAEIYVAPANDLAGPLVHALTGIRWVSVVLMPSFLRDPAEFPRTKAGTQIDRAYDEHEALVRARLGLRPEVPATRRARLAPTTLLAASESFYLPPAVHRPVAATGFWFAEGPEWAAWQAPRELVRFIEAGQPPVVLTFSSLPLADPAALLARHVRAAQLIGRRLVVLGGWAGFRADQLPAGLARDHVFFLDQAPHSWLFPRVAAVMTHGGIGTLARALACARPVLVEPFGNDQPFNALRVLRLGVGAAAHPHRATAESLAQMLEQVMTAPVQARLDALAAALGRDRGLAAAVEVIEAA